MDNLKKKIQDNKRSFKKKNSSLKKSGSGLYLYKNRSGGELLLPKAAKDGKIRIPNGELFIGDDYFKYLFYPHSISIVQELEKPGDEDMKESVLLTEQPPVYTEQGQVEFVKNETKDQSKEKLIVEPEDDETFVILK